MGSRIELHSILTGILGSSNVYFQPPDTIQMKYPCIVYERFMVNTKFANDLPYKLTNRWSVTVIDKNPDSSIPSMIARLPTCVFNRHYTVDNLNHDVYNLYY